MTGPGGYTALTADDYLTLLRRLGPSARLTASTAGTRFDQWLQAASEELARVHSVMVAAVYAEMTPETASRIIEGWLEAVGIPDECVPEIPATLGEQQAVALARWLATNGGTPAFFEEVALNLGFVVTVTEQPYSAFRVGTSRAGQRLGQADLIYYWQVDASATLTAEERALLECEINRLKPAHTVAVFVYS